jgi:Zinc-binding dehydrogenase
MRVRATPNQLYARQRITRMSFNPLPATNRIRLAQIQAASYGNSVEIQRIGSQPHQLPTRFGSPRPPGSRLPASRKSRLTTIAVTSNERKRAFAAACGADNAVCGDNWPGVVREIVGAAGVDLAFDPVGGDRLVDTLRLMAPEGRLLVVGFTAGEIPTVKVNRLLLGNIGVLGGGLARVLRTAADSHGRVVESVRRYAQDRCAGGSPDSGLALRRRTPGTASRRGPTQPRQVRTEPPYIAPRGARARPGSSDRHRMPVACPSRPARRFDRTRDPQGRNSWITAVIHEKSGVSSDESGPSLAAIPCGRGRNPGRTTACRHGRQAARARPSQRP